MESARAAAGWMVYVLWRLLFFVLAPNHFRLALQLRLFKLDRLEVCSSSARHVLRALSRRRSCLWRLRSPFVDPSHFWFIDGPASVLIISSVRQIIIDFLLLQLNIAMPFWSFEQGSLQFNGPILTIQSQSFCKNQPLTADGVHYSTVSIRAIEAIKIIDQLYCMQWASLTRFLTNCSCTEKALQNTKTHLNMLSQPWGELLKRVNKLICSGQHQSRQRSWAEFNEFAN